jgi:hypothetical protein
MVARGRRHAPLRTGRDHGVARRLRAGKQRTGEDLRRAEARREDQKYTFTLYAARTGAVVVPATTIAWLLVYPATALQSRPLDAA